MDRPIKPAPDLWWWPRLTPGFVVLSVVLGLLLVVVQLLSVDAGLYLMMAAVWGPILLSFRHRAKVAKRVMSRPDVTCPCCLRELADDAPCCPRCDTGLSRSVYVDYWTMVSEKPAEAEPWWRSMREAEGERGRSTYLSSASRWQVGCLAGMLLLSFTVVVVLRPAALLAMDTLWMLPMYLGIAGGIWLARTRGRRRAGTSTHCAGCDYQVDPSRPDMPDCPECGRRLNRPGQTVVGRRVGHGGYSLLGAGIVLLSVLSVFLPLVGGSFFDALSPGNYLPVSLYVDDALSSDPDYKTWDVLESRYAEPEDVRRLVEAVIADLAADHEETELLRGVRMDNALVYQLGGPNVPRELKHRLALALLHHPQHSRLYTLYDWLAQYAKSTTAGTAAHRELVAAAQDAFATGTLYYELINWLNNHNHQQLSSAWSLENFFAFMLRFDHVSTDDGPTLQIWQHPGITLNADKRPNRPIRVYLHSVQPMYSSGTRVLLRAQYDPIQQIGAGNALVTLRDTSDPNTPSSHRLVFLVAVGDQLPDAGEIRWAGDHPLLTDQQASAIDWYGPYQLHTGAIVAGHQR